MRLGSVFVFIGALALAVASGFMAQSWLERQRTAVVAPAPRVEPAQPMTRIVVASAPMRFGMPLSAANIREIDWPSGAVPAGAFRSTGDLLKANERRVVLSAIEANEPIMPWKVTGPGQRGTLSAVIEPGAKALTIRVNDVSGAAGFVLPGDRVDVLLTRAEERLVHNNAAGARTSETKKVTFTDVMLQNVRVLGIDQIADDRTDKPAVVKAVTLEVSTGDAQRLTLASTVGSLSLALRPAGAVELAATQRVTTADLGDEDAAPAPAIAATPAAPPTPAPQPEVRRTRVLIGITRATERGEYSVQPDRRLN